MKVLIVDDSYEARDGLKSILGSHGGIELVGEAEDGVEAIEKVEELRPDLVLMDAQMPGLDGIEATRRIKERSPNVKILLLLVHRPNLEDMRSCGADGYLMKDSPRKKILDTAMSMPGACK